MVVDRSIRAGTVVLALVLLVACGGDEKSSEIGKSPTQAVMQAASDPSASSWTPLATEWQTFDLGAPSTVRYGAGKAWVELTLPAGTHACSNDVFGDPSPGSVKQCEVASSSSSGSWVFASSEWGTFDLAAGGRVRFGADAGWVERDLGAGHVPCTSAFFGHDPAPGNVKQCEVWQGGSSSSGWTHLADEWAVFSLAAAHTVRYGAGDAWVERSLPAGSFTCSNATFGTDPAPGMVKHCEIGDGDASSTGWTALASEWSAFSLPAASTVRYGAGDTWVERSLPAGSHTCSNATFGTDPLPGATKHCELRSGGGTTPPPPPPPPAGTDRPANRAEAMRFLTQATFGPTEADIDRVTAIGYAAWIDEQFAKPASSHRSAWRAIDQVYVGAGRGDSIRQMGTINAFWRVAMSGNDQLRQRVAFALSQIMVISMREGMVGMNAEAVSAYLDMLADKGLGTYRELLQSVATHPLMGTYLSHLKNRKADPATGRVPDENFAREIMQLFSIGLHALNADGTTRTSGGVPIEAYSSADIAGLSKVFTGWSWQCVNLTESCYEIGQPLGTYAPSDWYSPLMNYPQYFSEEAKSFLGVSLPARSPGNAQADLAAALDTLAGHPNVAPFIGKQLIQRFVTSNPSPGYVADIARVFADNGAGRRGDMKSLVKAILLHPEARATSATSGKVREPILRVTGMVRSLGMLSRSGLYWIGNTDDSGLHLGQSPMNAPSVFNFYRPGYVSPGSASAAFGLVGPELQIVHETSAAGYVNYMRDAIDYGLGWDPIGYYADLVIDLEPFKVVADQPSTLLDRVAAKLLYTPLPAEVRQDIEAAIRSIEIPPPEQDPWWINARKEQRVKAALLLTVATPEYQVQR